MGCLGQVLHLQVRKLLQHKVCFVGYLGTPHLLMLAGQGAGHDTPPRVVGRAWHGPPPGVVGDLLPLHCGQSYDYWEKKRFMFNTAPLLSTL